MVLIISHVSVLIRDLISSHSLHKDCLEMGLYQYS